MKLTLKEIDDILQAEINWCLDNPDPELTHEQQMGFMNGLRQAQTLIEKAEVALTAMKDYENPHVFSQPNCIYMYCPYTERGLCKDENGGCLHSRESA